MAAGYEVRLINPHFVKPFVAPTDERRGGRRSNLGCGYAAGDALRARPRSNRICSPCTASQIASWRTGPV